MRHGLLDCDGVGDVCDDFTDQDQDGLRDEVDSCPRSGWGDHADGDGDGIGNGCDNCPAVVNPSQTDADYDWVGDDCDTLVDADWDGVADATDNCRGRSNFDQADADGDGFGDLCDPCPLAPGFITSPDSDWDGIGDACDPDRDGDGTLNEDDTCPDTRDPHQQDADGDGVGDRCDNCILIENPDQAIGNGGFGQACAPQTTGAQTGPLWRFYVGPAVGVVQFIGGVQRARQFGPAPRSLLMLNPLTGEAGSETTPYIARPSTISGTDLRARLEACGVHPFVATDIPLPTSIIERLGLRLHAWYVLTEGETTFALVDIDGTRVYWRQFTELQRTFDTLSDGRERLTFSAEPPQSDLAYFLKHYRCTEVEP